MQKHTTLGLAILFSSMLSGCMSTAKQEPKAFDANQYAEQITKEFQLDDEAAAAVKEAAQIIDQLDDHQIEQPESVEVQAQGECVSHDKQTTDSGLQYIIQQEAAGDAKSPEKGQMVHVHYTGWLADENGEPVLNKKFDSSVDRGQPFVFPIGVGMVIAGWDEGVLSMKVGEKRRLIIPSNLGYGARGAGAAIPPNADLVFDVELLQLGQ